MHVAVIIPSYKVKKFILSVLADIPDLVTSIYVIDDDCPENTGQHVLDASHDPRVSVHFHDHNLGVGGAVVTGYRRALEDGCDIVVKLDGDGQMNPKFIPKLIAPILAGRTDYVKGNRFFSLEALESMPNIRKFGNAILSFVNKVSSGYWNIMDPTNGYTAIHRTTLELLPLSKINPGYFFESDMLFRLGTLRAVVEDVPMNARYKEEDSQLDIGQTICHFPGLYVKSFFKRVFYLYYLRDFNRASLELLLASALIIFGSFWGVTQWLESIQTMEQASTGTVMLAVLPIILGFQLLLDAINFDVGNVPDKPLQKLYKD